ncbi:MAG: glycosyltransferase family 2 protein [Acidobacteriota bacterium]
MTKEHVPTVTVITTAYNVSAYIGEALSSVLAQTFTDYEVVVVNDGSEDQEELNEALAPYRDSIVYVCQENRGLAAARNSGLKIARGRYAAFLDADDIWEPDFLKQQVEFIEREVYDLVYANALLFGDRCFEGRTFMDIAPSHGEVTFRSLISGKCNIIGSAVLARREALFDAGLFDEDLRNAQDFDLWIRMTLSSARLGYQRRVLARYRYREGSLSGDATNRINRELRVYRKILAEYDITTAQRLEVESAIRRGDRELHLVQGKEFLNRREFPQALESFRKARAIGSNWKLRLCCVLLAIAPNLLVKLNSLLNKQRSHQRTILRNAP